MNAKLEIYFAISQSNYQTVLQNDFITFLRQNFANNKSKLYLFSRNPKAPKLFLLQTYLPGVFQGNSYDISVLCYFPSNFPSIPPEIYLEKIGNIKINPQCTFYIGDDTLKVNYDLFYKWNNKFTDLLGLFEELKHQFSFAFPIFNLPDSSVESNSISGDCILQHNLTAEIDLPPLPAPQMQLSNPYMNNTKILQKKEEIVIPRHNNTTYIKHSKTNTNDIANINPIPNKNVSPTRQVRVQSVPKNPINVPVSTKPVVANQIKKEVKLDENVIKYNLSQQVIKNILPKVKREIRANFSTTLRLEKVKESINKKIDKLSNIEKKNQELSVTVQKMQKDLDNYNVALPGKYDLTNLTNLDSLLNIPFKTTYEFQAREKGLDEMIALIKKSYEKGAIDFSTAIKLIRMNSRNLFFIKYKTQSVSLFNK